MGNCSCLERARVTAWGGGDDDDDVWGLPAAERYSGRARAVVSSSSTENGGGMRVKIRMTKGQLRRLLETSGRGGVSDEDVVAEIMRMGTVRVDVAELQQAAAERHRPPKLEAIQEDDVDE